MSQPKLGSARTRRAKIALAAMAMAALLALAGPPASSAHVGRDCHHFNYQHKHSWPQYWYWERWFMRYQGARRRYDGPGWSHIHVYKWIKMTASRGIAGGIRYVQCPKHSTRPG